MVLHFFSLRTRMFLDPPKLYLRPNRFPRILRVQLRKLPQNLTRPFIPHLRHCHLHCDNFIAARPFPCHRWHPAIPHAQLLPALRTRRNSQLRAPIDRRHVDAAPSAASLTVTGRVRCMSSPCRANTGCVPVRIIRYRSPGVPPPSPALPFPASRILCPSRVPGLIRNSSGSVRYTTPSPWHVAHAFCALPLPPQCGHWMLNFIRPPICVTCPVPWHSGQVCAPPVDARP